MAFLFQDQNQGIRNSGAHAKSREAPQPFSFIRTLTVGLGIAPNLLTLFPRKISREQGARGLGLLHPYRRWGLSPRPENIGCPIWATCGELCRVGRFRASTFGMGNQHVPMPPNQAWAAAIPGSKVNEV